MRTGVRLQRTREGLIFFNSFQGQFSDSPRAIFEELTRSGSAFSHVWRMRDRHAKDFPAALTTAAPGTWPHARGVAQAQYVVTNVHMADNVKVAGATWLQTWHGTPLKKIGFDKVSPLGREGERRYARGVAQWDYLISPNAFSTPIFRRAFRFDGPVLETGLPRNDILSSPERERIRADVRAKLGLEPGVTAILYAPTFRDDWRDPSGKFFFDIPLDLAAMANALGADHRLLMRLHRAIAFEAADSELDFVRNVTSYPDIRDLYLAADILVTDYSSVMFDFAITGKPIAFFAHDLDAYCSNVRGFYFDFLAEAPGPIAQTTDELLAVLQTPGWPEAHRDAYDGFRTRFCDKDDGQATRRVIDAVLKL